MVNNDLYFKAEDGIRVDLVTGVQTCARPIFGAAAECERERLLALGRGPEVPVEPVCLHELFERQVRERPRSEERRVGKECTTKRSWSLIKKQCHTYGKSQ